MHLKRWLTALVLLPLLFLNLIKGSPLVFSGLVVLVALIGMAEYLAIVSAGPDGPMPPAFKMAAYVFSAALIGAAHLQSAEGILFILAANLVVVSISVVLGFSRESNILAHMEKQVQGIVYIPAFLCFLVWLRHSDQGAVWVIWTWLIIAASDTGAFYSGTYLGKHPLCSRVSPKKTIEGAVGGIFLAVLVGLVFSCIFLPELPVLWVLCFSIVSTVAGQLGDLYESALKRAGSIKDSGHILPGHGGILDRIDAFIFALPVAFAFKAYLL
ncbi:MAG: phosphatidate cytidylyltransferase [Pseudomonadota bacterium]